MTIDEYRRGIPNYKGENGQTVGMLCETKEQCITDDDGVSLPDKLEGLKKYTDDAYANSNLYTDTKIGELINGAPTTLDTLKEIADAMEDNADVVEALDKAVGSKVDQAEYDGHADNDTIHVTAEERAKWNSNSGGGNAESVNGFKIYNTPSQLGLTSNHIPDIVNAMPKTSIFIAAVVSGYSFALASANNKLPHPNGLLHIEKSNESTRTSIMYYGMDSANVFGVWQCDLNMSTSTIDGWIKVNDGGNADTVDGLHADVFSRHRNNMTLEQINESGIIPYTGMISTTVATSAGLPSGTYRIHYVPDQGAGYGTQIAYGGTSLVVYHRLAMGGNWTGWKKLANADEVLPLDGSKPMSGENLFLGGGFGRFHGDYGVTSMGSLEVTNNVQNMRAIEVCNESYVPSLKSALRFRDTIEGVHKYYDVHHDGNSAKCVVVDTDPGVGASVSYADGTLIFVKE